MSEPYEIGTKVLMKKNPEYGENGFIRDRKRFESGLWKGMWVYSVERETGVCSVVDADDFDVVTEGEQ